MFGVRFSLDGNEVKTFFADIDGPGGLKLICGTRALGTRHRRRRENKVNSHCLSMAFQVNNNNNLASNLTAFPCHKPDPIARTSALTSLSR